MENFHQKRTKFSANFPLLLPAAITKTTRASMNDLDALSGAF